MRIYSKFIALLLFLPAAACAPRGVSPSMASLRTEAPLLPAEVVRSRVQAGQAVLVCAYDNDEECGVGQLRGAITHSALQKRLPDLARQKQLIFYCDCSGDSTALRLAELYRRRGYANVAVLKGGTAAYRATKRTDLGI